MATTWYVAKDTKQPIPFVNINGQPIYNAMNGKPIMLSGDDSVPCESGGTTGLLKVDLASLNINISDILGYDPAYVNAAMLKMDVEKTAYQRVSDYAYDPFQTIVTNVLNVGLNDVVPTSTPRRPMTMSPRNVANATLTSSEKTGKSSDDNPYQLIHVKDYDEAKLHDAYYHYITAFGCPHQYGPNVDIQYGAKGKNKDEDPYPAGGRVFVKTIFSNPTILSICPGAVNYLPDIDNTEEQNFWDSIQQAMGGTMGGEEDYNREFGRLFTIQSAYAEYVSYVSFLCRLSAVLLGLGDTNMPYTGTKLKSYDYSAYTLIRKRNDIQGARQADKPGNIMDKALDAARTAWNTLNSNISLDIRDQYVHFFLTGDGATNVSDQFEIGVSSSVFEDLLKGKEQEIHKNLGFLFGGAIGSYGGSILDESREDIGSMIGDVVDSVTDTFGSGDGVMENLMSVLGNFAKGGKMTFPKVIDDVGYSQSIQCNCNFRSMYGDKLSIFLHCYIPTMHLLAFSLPKMITTNMYTYPFIVRACQRGFFSVEMGVISGISIDKASSSSSEWTVDGLCMNWNVSFQIIPLFSQLMINSVRDGPKAVTNVALFEYLSAQCGYDMLDVKYENRVKMVIMLIQNQLGSILPDTGRQVTTRFGDVLQWFKFPA